MNRTIHTQTFAATETPTTILWPHGIVVIEEGPKTTQEKATAPSTATSNTSQRRTNRRGFTSPLKGPPKKTEPEQPNTVIDKLRAKESAVAAKEKAIEELRERSKIAEAAEKSGELSELTTRWMAVTRKVLKALQSHDRAPRKPDTGAQFTMSEILTSIGLSPEAVRYDAENECFEDDSDDDD